MQKLDRTTASQVCLRVAWVAVFLFALAGLNNAYSQTVLAEENPRYISLEINAAMRSAIIKDLPQFNPNSEVEVPFTNFDTADKSIRLLFLPGTLKSTLEIDGSQRISFPRDGVPLQVIQLGNDQLAVFFREMFSGKIYFYRISKIIDTENLIVGSSDAEPILRAATLHNNQLFAVFYDNARRVNEVVRIPDEKITGEIVPELITQLPSLEHPAGGNYEMIANLRLFHVDDDLWVIGGTLLARVAVSIHTLQETSRLSGCRRAQDVAVINSTISILCLARATGKQQPFKSANYVISDGESSYKHFLWSRSNGLGEIPMPEKPGLPVLGADGDIAFAQRDVELTAILLNDLVSNHNSGLMELGTNNLEGRVAWSQIYFLNGLLDAIRLATQDTNAHKLFKPLLARLKQRLDIEVFVLDQLIASPYGFYTKGFTANRVPALFAVQTSRLLLLYDRYLREIENGSPIVGRDSLRTSIMILEDHIEQFAIARPGMTEPTPGHRYLKWPKGSAFYFDGLNVPYNHQNEWAYSVLHTLEDDIVKHADEARAAQIAIEVIDQFLGAVAPNDTLPPDGIWPYWWGRAGDVWTEEDGVSLNTPNFPGDRLIAWISFRSIDVMATLSAVATYSPTRRSALKKSIAGLVSSGLVFPFVSASYVKRKAIPHLKPTVAKTFARMTGPTDLQSSIWAYFSLSTHLQSNSRILD